jgi:selenocysteine lyase/cysteine desulfurase
MTPESFRSMFPALDHTVWLDTPATAPGAIPVMDAVAEALEQWRTGQRRWSAWWQETRQQCRSLIAAYLGVPDSCVALMGSFAEAAATVAACLPPGRVVVGAEEYRSNLFPWLALEGGAHEVACVRSPGGGVRTRDLVAAITPGTVLVAVSEVLSYDGVRADLPALRRAADEVGARLFVDAADHAWFGGPLRAASGAARCDTSPAWLSWAGARAALELSLALPREQVERHCLRLAAAFRAGARAAGAVPVGDGTSHIAAVQVADPPSLLARLESAGIRAVALGDRLRVGFHYFNDDSDVGAILRMLQEEQ